MCVVLVDDEPYVRLIASEILQDAGHTVVEFASAAEARAYCDVAGNWLTTMLTDIDMPGGENGLQLAAHIRTIRPHARVIVTSGRYGSLPYATLDGVVFLPKPYAMAELLRVIGEPQVKK